MPSFVRFQYGKLNPENRAHKSVIDLLMKNGVNPETLAPSKGLDSPSEGCKDKDKDKDKDKEEEKDLLLNQKHSKPHGATGNNTARRSAAKSPRAQRRLNSKNYQN